MISEIYNHCITNGRYGFTIPYLFRIQKQTGIEKDINEILLTFANSNEKYFISFCADLDEYIIGLPKREIGNVDMYEHFGNLYYDDNKMGTFQSIDEIAEFMKNRYQKYIDNETFSKNFNTLVWE